MPQPLKWVGAVLVLAILVIVVAPAALDAMLGTVSFSDEGGLFGGGDDPLEEGVDEEADDDVEEAEAADEEAEEEEIPDSYVVESGDTLFSIAVEFYGDGGRWVDIAEANGIEEGESVQVGQELVLP